jgi:hypothetical protein
MGWDHGITLRLDSTRAPQATLQPSMSAMHQEPPDHAKCVLRWDVCVGWGGGNLKGYAAADVILVCS